MKNSKKDIKLIKSNLEWLNEEIDLWNAEHKDFYIVINNEDFYNWPRFYEKIELKIQNKNDERDFFVSSPIISPIYFGLLKYWWEETLKNLSQICKDDKIIKITKKELEEIKMEKCKKCNYEFEEITFKKLYNCLNDVVVKVFNETHQGVKVNLVNTSWIDNEKYSIKFIIEKLKNPKIRGEYFTIREDALILDFEKNCHNETLENIDTNLRDYIDSISIQFKKYQISNKPIKEKEDKYLEYRMAMMINKNDFIDIPVINAIHPFTTKLKNVNSFTYEVYDSGLDKLYGISENEITWIIIADGIRCKVTKETWEKVKTLVKIHKID